MKRLHLWTSAMLLLWACGDGPRQANDAGGETSVCGEDGVEVERDGVVACLYERPKVVTETGFMCPPEAPFMHDWDLVVVCASQAELPDEVVGELADEIPPWTGPGFGSGAGGDAVDVLFVVDDSHSMLQEQSALTEYAGQLFSTVVALGADFHAAVVTTNTANEDGAFRVAPGEYINGEVPEAAADCPEQTGPVLSAADYLLDPENPSAGLDHERLAQDFRCLCMAGVSGSGFEQGLEAMRRALSPDRLASTNAGFRRDGAWLVIVFLSDENDCSNPLLFTSSAECEWRRDDLVPVTEYIDFLENLPGTGGGARVVVTAITGPDNAERPVVPEDPRPSCTNLETGDAYSGYRYIGLAEHFGTRGVVGNICFDAADTIDYLRSLLIGLIDP